MSLSRSRLNESFQNSKKGIICKVSGSGYLVIGGRHISIGNL